MSEEKSLEFLIEGGSATAGPPIGPALGPLGVNVPAIVEAINKETKDFSGMRVPVKVIVNTRTKAFRIEVGTPTTAALIVKEAGISKGSGKAGSEFVGNLSLEQVLKIARIRLGKSLAKSLKDVVKEVLGTCLSMGVRVDGKNPKEMLKEIIEGKHGELFKGTEHH
ncbi:50S ribosomal protein L11 [Candidatus Bathyarchaeota archaeon]|nr:50S ribosomal protein L11 [Candidatus Bathyarchaeota archaeon]